MEEGLSKELAISWIVKVLSNSGHIVQQRSDSELLDTSNIVELGFQAGRPVVTVNMQYVIKRFVFCVAALTTISSYRVNYFGFLACQVGGLILITC